MQSTQALSDRLTIFGGKLKLLDETPAANAKGLRLN